MHLSIKNVHFTFGGLYYFVRTPSRQPYFQNINFLCEIFTEKYRTEVFFVQTEPVGRGLYKKTKVRYFSVRTKQARLIKSFII